MLTIQDMKRICKFSMKSYKKNCTSNYAIEIEPVNEYIRVYFTNGVSAGRLEIIKSQINVDCDCCFMPCDFVKNLKAADKLTVSYLRDIECINLTERQRKRWHSQFESPMKTSPWARTASLKIVYDARLICDVLTLIKQLGFKRFNMSFASDRVGYISAFEGRASIEFVIMPIVR